MDVNRVEEHNLLSPAAFALPETPGLENTLPTTKWIWGFGFDFFFQISSPRVDFFIWNLQSQGRLRKHFKGIVSQIVSFMLLYRD